MHYNEEKLRRQATKKAIASILIALLFIATINAEDIFVQPELTDNPSWLDVSRRQRYAENPTLTKILPSVHFRSFCAETFAEATKADKPILLFIAANWRYGYKKTTLADLEIVTRLNEQFIPARLNRDERPDVDLRMQQAAQLLCGARGWPLIIFLTPDGRPFFGGINYPAEDDAALGQLGLRSVIQHILTSWREKRADVLAQATALDELIKKNNNTRGALAPNLPQLVIEKMQSAFDQKGGGFFVNGAKTAAKFPAPRALEALLMHYTRRGEQSSLDMATKTLDAMLSGGIYDQIEGGFYHYTTDRWWRQPRLEKLLIPNAEMLTIYLHAWQVTGRARYRQAVEETLNFWNDLSALDGVFFCNSLAASDDEDARFAWTMRDIEAALRDDTDCQLAKIIYGIDENSDGARHALFEAAAPSVAAKHLGLTETDALSRLTRIRQLLLKARQQRLHLISDYRVYCDSNALMAAAFIECGRILEKPLYWQRGVAILERLLKQGLRAIGDEALVVHILEDKKDANVLGLAQDEAALAYACVSAHLATGEKKFLSAADDSLRRLDRNFLDKERGGYFDRAIAINASAEMPILRLPIKVFQDTSEPSANALTALASARLYALTARKEYAERAVKIVEAFGAALEKLGPYSASLITVIYALQK